MSYSKRLHSLMSGAALSLTLLFAGCAGSVSYRTYDRQYRDYHVWSNVETPYFNTWIVETHHPRIEYRRLRRSDREAYWRWRHDHR